MKRIWGVREAKKLSFIAVLLSFFPKFFPPFLYFCKKFNLNTSAINEIWITFFISSVCFFLNVWKQRGKKNYISYKVGWSKKVIWKCNFFDKDLLKILCCGEEDLLSSIFKAYFEVVWGKKELDIFTPFEYCDENSQQ